MKAMVISDVCLEVSARAKQDGGAPVCFAAVDDAGELVYLYRIDGAPARLVNIAIGKAYTAARMKISTAVFRHRLVSEKLSLADFLDDGLTALPGGLPLFDQGILLGAVAVSGRSLEEDVKLCQRFAELVLSRVNSQ